MQAIKIVEMHNSNSGQSRRDQRKDWESVAVGWQKWYRIFETGASKMSYKLIEMAKIKQASKVLDIATGIGEPAITVARYVGTSGHVLATDISLQMLSIARERAIAEHLEGIIDFNEGDAATMRLPELSFDAALCRLGLMFLDDLDSGLSNIYNSLVKGGRFAASVWARPEKVPQLALAMDTIRKELDIPLSTPLGTAGPFSLADESILKDSFVSCGFKVIDIERINIAFEFDSPLQYTNFTKDIAAPVLTMLANQSSERKEQIWKAVTKEATKFVKDDTDSIVLDNEAICIVGEKRLN